MPLSRFMLMVTVSMLFSLGLVMIFNTTSAEILDWDLDRNPYVSLFKQILYVLFGLILAWTGFHLGVKRWIKLSPLALAFMTFLLVLCFVPGIGRAVNGSRRWIVLGGFSIQPSEFVKFIIPSYFIYRLGKKDSETISLMELLKTSIVVFIPLWLIFIEPNNGTVGVIGLSVGMLLFLMHVSYRIWALPLCIILLIGGGVAYQLPYVKERLNVYFNPELDIRGRGHQPLQARIAAGSGKLWGKGPGNSLQKMSYLPEAQNDYIAAIYAEEFGFIGVSGLIFLYLLLAYFGFSIAYHAKGREETLLAAIFVFLISFQAFMNLGVVSGLLPSTGLNLPFFSQGGSSLIANCLAVGLIFSAERKERTFIQNRLAWTIRG